MGQFNTGGGGGGGAAEVPLTFNNGLTRSTNTVTNNLIVGVAGGQTIKGGTAVTDAMTYQSTTGIGTATAIGHSFTGGNNGATTILNLFNNGNASLVGKLSIGNLTAPSSQLHIQTAGSATANSAPIQVTNGARETISRAGLVELENNWYHTNNSLVRYSMGGVIADFITDVATTTATTETDLYTLTTAAGTLAVNGDKIVAEYALQIKATGGTTKQIKAYFGSTLVLDTGAMSISTATDMNMIVRVIRDSATTVRVSATASSTGAPVNQFAKITKLTGLTLSNTNIIKITATVGTGAVAGDVTAISGFVQIKGAA